MPTRIRPQLDDNEVSDRSEQLDEFQSNRVTKDGPGSTIQSGWASKQRPRSQGTYQKVPRLIIAEDGEETIIKFLEHEPFAAYFVHWINKRSYTCPGQDVCPACARGDKAKANNLLNVVVMGENPELVVWYATADPSTAIEDKATSKKGPLNKTGMYMAVSKKKGTNGYFSYSLEWVREDELSDDWGLRALSSEELAKFNSEKYDGSIVRTHTVNEIAEVARQHLDQE